MEDNLPAEGNLKARVKLKRGGKLRSLYYCKFKYKNKSSNNKYSRDVK